MPDFLTDPNYWRDGMAFMVTFYQAGFNMIPQIGWRQAVESWSASKIGDSK